MSFHALRFNRSAELYEREAGIQAGMAERLLALPAADGDVRNILEFGCGTGLLTRKLMARHPSAPILATDAAPGMLAEARRRCGPAARLEFALQDARGGGEASAAVSRRAPFDLIASNAVVQWFPDLETHLRFAARLSREGGFYRVSGFTRSNFPELNALLREPPFSYSLFPGHEAAEIHASAEATGWRLLEWDAWEEKEILPSAREVLRRIQTLGSSRDPREGGRLNRKNLDYLVSEYARRFPEGGGVGLTWRPWAALLAQ